MPTRYVKYPMPPMPKGTGTFRPDIWFDYLEERQKNMKKHTPTPWTVEYDNSDSGEMYRCGPAIIKFPYNESVEDDERHWADAHLVAAAPELLEALESIENDDGHIPDKIWQMRNDAIKAAKGELIDDNER